MKIVVENDEWTISCFGFEKLSGFKCSPKKVTDGEEAVSEERERDFPKRETVIENN